METTKPVAPPAARSLPETITRLVRHEVGDLLQSLYATTAILSKRLPKEWSQEQRVLGDLKARAEACRQLMDSVHDFVCPVSLAWEEVQLAELARNLVTSAAPRFPQLEIRAEASEPGTVLGDSRRMAEVGTALLQNACEAAQRKVSFRTQVNATRKEVEWTVTDDGPGVPPEQQSRLFTPFFSTRHRHAGLGLALAQKIVSLHGGRIYAANQPDGGLCVRVVMPQEPLESQRDTSVS
jgi:signal transduction histidine kinase